MSQPQASLMEKRLTSKLNKALRNYGLIDNGDNILVALSGGKDSLCLLDLLVKRRKIFIPQFTLQAIHVRMENIAYHTDTGYLEEFCRDRDVPLHIVTTSFDPSTDKRKSPCFLCSWMRRKEMFNFAQQLGCNKIALGHHNDDIIHTALMNECFQGRFDTMPALLKMNKMPLAIIRPLCLCEEADIRAYAAQQGYKKQIKTCPYEKESFRDDIKEIFQRMEKLNPDARHSIWNALEREGKIVEGIVCHSKEDQRLL
ncbi:MAG: tRNA 2-thiocytidine biosynthesis protein TtcA [Prevotella sp.]|nr:tRNA 2-thiocytidine biosynthesis protein TtcA [Prevotella sp.]